MSCEIDFKAKYISIQGLNLYAPFVISPDGRWLAALEHQAARASQGEDSGRVVILSKDDHNTVTAVVSSVLRPFGGAIADNGNVVVNGASAAGSGRLWSSITVFDYRGHELYRRTCEANTYSVGISRCGRFIALQTMGAPDSSDSLLLEVHDVALRRCIFSVHPTAGWVEEYEFEIVPEGFRRLYVVDPSLGRFAYDKDGAFLDRENFLDARLQRGEFDDRILAAEELIAKKPPASDLNRALEVLDECLELCEDRADWAAIAWRNKGEALALLERSVEALVAYERALSLNSKIGVKRKIITLKKQLSKS